MALCLYNKPIKWARALNRFDMLLKIISVFIGGGLGAILRYGLTILSTKHLSTPIIGTFSANIIGCFAIGCFFGFVLNRAESVPQVTKLFITTGTRWINNI